MRDAGRGWQPSWQGNSEVSALLASGPSAGSSFVLSQIAGFSNVRSDRRAEAAECVPHDDELTQTGSKE